jgi:hypothetical protein
MKQKRYNDQFKQEVIDCAKEIGVWNTCKKYKSIVYPDTVRRWVVPGRDEIVKENNKKWYSLHLKGNPNHIIKRNTYIKQYRESEHGKKKVKEYAKNWYARNKEENKKACKAWYQKNKKASHQKQYERYKNDPNTRITQIHRGKMCALVKQGKAIKHTQSYIDLFGCTVSELNLHLEKQFKPGMTWDNHAKFGWHIDHIIPCASFDLTKLEEQKKCFHYTNFQPLWWQDNLHKKDKLDWTEKNSVA